MVKLITGIAFGVAIMQFINSNDGKVFKEKLTKLLNEQNEQDNGVSESTAITEAAGEQELQ